MVKHIIIWNFKEELSADERAAAAEKIKSGLEGLMGQIDGLTEIKVFTNPFESSNGDLMLDSTFTSEDALKGYQVNPKHIEVATFVRSVVGSRKCFDFEL
ncbi:MAG: Dabb family protein [Clostridia bacterium]|nr:Dabb family protein [Clostridia bacterium]